MRSGLIIGVVAGAAALLAVVGFSELQSDLSAASRPRARAALPSVLVVAPGKGPLSPLVAARECGPSPNCRNGAGGIVVVTLLSGAVAAAPVTAVVLTDTQCMPDRYGISHCLNKLRLSGGAVLLVRHDHDMHLYPCLNPGERVRVMAPSA